MNNHLTVSFPSITTERLLLRKPEATDEQGIFNLRSNDQVNEFLDRPKMNSPEEAARFIEKINTGIDDKEWFYWVITSKEDPSLVIGTICLWNFSGDRSVAEIGYELAPGMQGKGIMQETVAAVIDHAFNKI